VTLSRYYEYPAYTGYPAEPHVKAAAQAAQEAVKLSHSAREALSEAYRLKGAVKAMTEAGTLVLAEQLPRAEALEAQAKHCWDAALREGEKVQSALDALTALAAGTAEAEEVGYSQAEETGASGGLKEARKAIKAAKVQVNMDARSAEVDHSYTASVFNCLREALADPSEVDASKVYPAYTLPMSHVTIDRHVYGTTALCLSLTSHPDPPGYIGAQDAAAASRQGDAAEAQNAAGAVRCSGCATSSGAALCQRCARYGAVVATRTGAGGDGRWGSGGGGG